MGSQRLAKKNLRELGGIPLITRAIRKCQQAGCFDEIWVNSEHLDFGEIAKAEGVNFHHRPLDLGNSVATSEQYVAEFLENRECEFLFQVHSIAPLLSVEDTLSFVERMNVGDLDCLLSVEEIQIECAKDGVPINFSWDEKTNSQELEPVQRICWSITGWRRDTYLDAFQKGECATYCGRVGMQLVSSLAAHVIKTERDLQIAETLCPLVFSE
ncbi:Cytidylyltransferase, putative [Verrucomicrobiia bacterium DG1235]|nr:Cytidylyltransferase, putative [Verrucomicrobiae bacterium DG1235]